ncbi:MAG: MarC family protein [Bdellovibrionales bacterium]
MDLELLNRFFVVFSTLIVIVDPIGVVPAFISLTRGYTPEASHAVIKKASVTGAAVLLLFSLFGTYLFSALSLNLNAFKVGGGLLLLLTALEMLRGKADDCKCSAAELSAPQEREDISFVPVAIPLLAGPGAITSIMVFSTDHQSNHTLHFSVIAAAIAFTFVLSYFILRSSSVIAKAIGRSGVSVVQRLMGLILSALSIQLIVEGATKLVSQIVQSVN